MRLTLFASATAVCLMIGLQSSAQAALFNFSYSGLQFGTSTSQNVMGTITTNAPTAISSGNQTITGISGTDNGAPITGLAASGSYLGNDNLLLYNGGSGSFLDHNGLGFSTAAYTANIFTDFGGYLYEDNSGITSIGGTFTLTPAAAVPEPASIMLFGAGLLGLAFVAYRRRVNS